MAIATKQNDDIIMPGEFLRIALEVKRRFEKLTGIPCVMASLIEWLMLNHGKHYDQAIRMPIRQVKDLLQNALDSVSGKVPSLPEKQTNSSANHMLFGWPDILQAVGMTSREA